MKGCFGSVICHSVKSVACQQCDAFSECYTETKANLGKIGAQAPIDTSRQTRRLHQHEVENGLVEPATRPIVSGKREQLTQYQMSIITNPQFPEKARKLAATLFRKGMTGKYLRNMLRVGANPFRGASPKICEMACDLIIDDSLSVERLRRVFIESGQSDKTALAQAHNVVKTFLLMSVLTKQLKLRGEE